MSKKPKQNDNLDILRYGIFFDAPLSRPDLITNLLVEKYSNIFDAPPLNLPIPDEVEDVPANQLTSKDGGWRFTTSKRRADISIKKVGDKSPIDEKNIAIEIIRFVKELAKDQQCKISRITNIRNFVIEVENPDILINSKLKNPRNDFAETLIRFNQKLTEKGIACNNLTQLETVENNNDKNLRAVGITKDFNTDPSRHTDITDTEFNKFIELSDKHATDLEWVLNE